MAAHLFYNLIKFVFIFGSCPIATDFTETLAYNLSMEIVYIDSMFLLNFIIDYLLLVLSFRFSGLYIKRWRCAISAAIGGLYAVLCFVPGFGVFATPWFKIALWVGMSLIAFGGEEYLFKCALSFLVISIMFGGGVWAASMLIGGSGMYQSATRINMRTLIFSFALCYAVLSLALSRKLSVQPREVLPVKIILRGKTTCLNALRDTGNSLRDPATGKRVLTAGVQALSGLFTHEEIVALSDPDGVQVLLKLGEIEGAPRFRPIIYSAVGVKTALMPTVSPDELYIGGEKNCEYVIAVSPTAIGDDEFSAVI